MQMCNKVNIFIGLVDFNVDAWIVLNLYWDVPRMQKLS
jgi:hypothetical protein